MLNLLNRLVKEEEGQGLVEYALIIALVSVALIAGLNALAGPDDGSGGIKKVFKDITSEF